MAIIRSTSSQKRVGRVGSDSYYVRDGKQVVRQALNNSNYGESASRTEAQQRRRVRWANLVNLYRAMKAWQPKAYESKVQGQTDYNIFVSLNINRASVALTKDMAINGCAVVDRYQISRGSLPSITFEEDRTNTQLISDISTGIIVNGETTVGALSRAIIENNAEFENGDNLALPTFAQMLDGDGYPYVVSSYRELTLDVDSNVLVSSLDIYRFLSSTASEHLILVAPGSSFGSFVGMSLIHTRRKDGLQVSSQNIQLLSVETQLQFSSESAIAAAIESYGLSTRVLLEPGS